MQPAALPSLIVRSYEACRGSRSFILPGCQACISRVHTVFGWDHIVTAAYLPAPADPLLEPRVCATDLLAGACTCTGEDDGAAIELAFSKKKIDERKEWLAACEPGTYLDMTPEQISYSDFINKVGGSSCFRMIVRAFVR